MTALITTPTLILTNDLVIKRSTWSSGVASVVIDGLIPFVFVLAGIAGVYLMMKRRFSASRNEAIQAVFVLLGTTFIILTIIGVFFRGPGMKLMWPWDVGGTFL